MILSSSAWSSLPRPKVDGVFDGREVALGREELAAAGHVAGLELDLGADGVAVGRLAVAGQVEADPVVLVAAVVAEEAGRAVVDRDDDVEVAVAVDIGVGRPAADDRPEQVGTGVLGLDQHVRANGPGLPEFQKSCTGCS